MWGPFWRLLEVWSPRAVACFPHLVIQPRKGHAIVHFYHSAGVFSCRYFPSTFKPTLLDVSQSLCHNPCRSLELKCDFDEQAQWQSPALYFRIPPTVGVQEAKTATVGSQTQNVLQYVSFTALDTEEKLHWTQARILTCCHTVDTYCNSNSAPANSHECDDQCEWNVFVLFLCKMSAFWFCVGQKCYRKNYYIFKKKKIHKIVFSWWNGKVSGVYNLSALCCKLEWLSTFFFKT